MNSDEEYLDDLLNSLMDEDEGDGVPTSEEGAAENSELDEGMLPEDSDLAVEDFVTDDLSAEDLSSEDLNSEDLGFDDFMSEDLKSDDDALEDFNSDNLNEADSGADGLGMEELQEEEEGETNGEEEDLLLDDFALEDFGEEEPAPEDTGALDSFFGEEEIDGASEGKKGMSPDEVDAMFAAADEADDFSETEPTEEDMFALWDNMSEMEEEHNATDGIVDEVQEAAAETVEEEESEKGKKKKKEKKEKKERKSLFGRKKKNQMEESGGEGTENTAEGEYSETELPADITKPQVFFGRLLSFLTETDEEEAEEGDHADGLEPSDENKNILKELDDEDKKKKKKKVKGKKGEEEEEEKGKKKKPKKEKKKKEKKEKKEESSSESISAGDVKRGKRVSIKSIAVIAGLCLTVTAIIIVLCSIIPVFFDKRAARDAFYESDYKKSYELLYGKKRDENDEMIYNKSKTILEMQRKLDSYHNYLGIGKEVQALDALMSGVENYPAILIEAEEYRVVQEVNAIYETILNILNDKYSLTEALAQTIIEYDDVTYTRRLESLVNNTPFVMPQEEENVPADTDILPEERALMEQGEELAAEEEAGMAEQGNVQEEFPAEAEENGGQEELPQGQSSETQESTESQSMAEEQQSGEQEAAVQEAGGQTTSSSQGEDVSTWTGESGYGSQGEQIQGIRQPIGIEIHGN